MSLLRAIPNLSRNVPDLAACYDPHFAATVDAYGRISQLTDLSGNGKHLTQTTDANKPILSRGDSKENLFTESGFDKWTLGNLTRDASEAPSPDGSSAYKLIETAATGSHLLSRASADVFGSSGVTYVFSVYAKAAERTWIRLSTGNTLFPDDQYAYFNIGAGELGNKSAGIISSIESAGSGWYRCSVSLAADATVSNGQFMIHLSEAGANVSYAGNIAKGLYLWGMQQRSSTSDSTYLAGVAYPQYAGINGRRVAVFDGVDDYMANGDIPVAGLSDVTAIMFFKNDDITLVGRTLLSNQSLTRFPQLTGSAGGRNIVGGHAYFSSFGLADANRNIITTIYQGNEAVEANKIRLYLNGIAVARSSGDNSSIPNPLSNNGFNVGTYYGSATSSVKGSLGATAIYSRALSIEELGLITRELRFNYGI